MTDLKTEQRKFLHHIHGREKIEEAGGQLTPRLYEGIFDDVKATTFAHAQRQAIYAGNPSEQDTARIRDKLYDALRDMETQYAKEVDGDTHLKNIEHLAAYMTDEFGNQLHEGHFRIGRTQMALNIFVKHLWCFEKCPVSPHCPVDRMVVKATGTDYLWTQSNSIKEYRKVIAAGQLKLSKAIPTLAEWELRLYNKDRENRK